MRLPGWFAVLLRHPVISSVLGGCTVAGAVAGLLLLDPEWSMLRRGFAGAVGGAWVGLLFTATKIVGQ
jgi:hypothetical protein